MGAPVLEINVAEEQLQDLMDDAIQRFQDRHMDGVEKMYLKHKITKNWLDSLQATSFPGEETSTGLTTTTSASVNITGIGTTTYSFEESQNFIQIPDAVIGIEKVWKLDNIIVRKAKHTLELCAIYWHFLLAVWIVLFGLMLFS